MRPMRIEKEQKEKWMGKKSEDRLNIFQKIFCGKSKFPVLVKGY